MVGWAIGIAQNCLKMLLKLGLDNRAYKNIHQQFSFIRNTFFGNEYNCFEAEVYFCFLLQAVPKSYTRLEKNYIYISSSA